MPIILTSSNVRIKAVIETHGLWPIHGRRSPPVDNDTNVSLIRISVPVKLQRCGMAMRMLVEGQKSDKPDQVLIEALSKSQEWFRLLSSGEVSGVGEIAQREGIGSSYVGRILYRAFLAPDIVRAILQGKQPPHLNLEFLKRHLPLPIVWEAQRQLLGFPSSRV